MDTWLFEAPMQWWSCQNEICTAWMERDGILWMAWDALWNSRSICSTIVEEGWPSNMLWISFSNSVVEVREGKVGSDARLWPGVEGAGCIGRGLYHLHLGRAWAPATPTSTHRPLHPQTLPVSVPSDCASVSVSVPEMWTCAKNLLKPNAYFIHIL